MQQQGGPLLVQRWHELLLVSSVHICQALRPLQVGASGRLEVAFSIGLCRAVEASLCAMCDGRLARPPGPLQEFAPFWPVLSLYSE